MTDLTNTQEISHVKHDDFLRHTTLMAQVLDTQFRIPGTKIRFGVDALVGLIPYAGDILTFLVSGYLVIIMARRGGSPFVVTKMLWNIWVDGVIGTIPFVGDIFDISHKANIKNIGLLQEYYVEGKHKKGLFWILLIVAIILIAMIAISLYAIRLLFIWIIT